MSYPQDDLAAIVRALQPGVPVVVGWPSSKLVTPAYVIHPTQRSHLVNGGADWTLSLDAVVDLAADQTAIHGLVEAVVPLLPAGWHASDTSYGQGTLGGADLVIAATPITTKRRAP